MIDIKVKRRIEVEMQTVKNELGRTLADEKVQFQNQLRKVENEFGTEEPVSPKPKSGKKNDTLEEVDESLYLDEGIANAPYGGYGYGHPGFYGYPQGARGRQYYHGGYHPHGGQYGYGYPGFHPG